MNSKENKVVGNNKTQIMVFISMFTVLIAVCSWISLPLTVPFTMQTFAIFCTLLLLGGKRGTISILLYLIIGSIGVPVFHNFTGGIPILFGPTGGYLIGFLFSALIYWGINSLPGKKTLLQILGLLLGLLACYAFGTVWFLFVSKNGINPVSLLAVLSWCVFPFIVPDLAKMALAFGLSKILKRYLPEF